MYGRTFVVRHNKDLSICLHLIILTAFEQYWTDLSIERQLLQGHLARQLRRYSARTRGTSTHIHDRIPFVCHCLQVCTCNLLCTRNSTWLSVRAVPTTMQFLHFEDDVSCVLLVAAILTFVVSDVPFMENGRLPTLAHLLRTYYLTI